MRAVGNDGDIVLGRDGLQRVHVAGHAAVVHGHDGARLRRNGGFHCRWVDGVVAGIAVHEDGNGVGLQHGGSTRHKGNGGDNYLIPRLDSHRPQRRFERHGAVSHGNAILGVLEGGKITLEPAHLGIVLVCVSAPPPDAAIQHALQQGLFLFAEYRPGKIGLPSGSAIAGEESSRRSAQDFPYRFTPCSRATITANVRACVHSSIGFPLRNLDLGTSSNIIMALRNTCSERRSLLFRTGSLRRVVKIYQCAMR